MFHKRLIGENSMRSVLQATKNNLELQPFEDVHSTESVRQFYKTMTKTLDLEHQQVLLAISRPSEIRALSQENSVFLTSSYGASNLSKS